MQVCNSFTISVLEWLTFRYSEISRADVAFAAIFFKGSFTYDVITLGGGGGGFQMMTIDDEGEGGVLANDDVITGTQFFGKM